MKVERATTEPKQSGRRGWRFWLGITLSFACVLWLIVTTDWAEAWTALLATNYGLVLAAVAINILVIPLRTLRWRRLFPESHRLPFRRLTGIMLIGQAVNLLAPMRLGEVVQATLAGSDRAPYVLGTQMLRLALDLLMMSVLVIVLLFQVSLPDWWRAPGQLLLLTSVAALAGMITLVAARRKIERFLTWLKRRWLHPKGQRFLSLAIELVHSLDAFSNRSTLLFAVLLSVFIWLSYVLVNSVLLVAVGEPFSWLAAVFVLVVLSLGAAIPSSPGRVGVYHFLGVAALTPFGVDQASAVTYSILLHLITVIIPVMLAAVFAWQQGLRVNETMAELEE